MPKRVLNIGGGDKSLIKIPHLYDGWDHYTLDIDPNQNPDILLDARDLEVLGDADWDSIYCSHTLEHFIPQEMREVLSGIYDHLKQDGFIFIRVPDIGMTIQVAAEKKLDLTSVLYGSAAGDIAVIDVLYGYRPYLTSEFMSHKTGFDQYLLKNELLNAGFLSVFISQANYELFCFAFKVLITEKSAFQEIINGL